MTKTKKKKNVRSKYGRNKLKIFKFSTLEAAGLLFNEESMDTA